MNKKLKLKIHESLSAVIPITLIVLALGMTVVPMELSTLMLFLAGAALLILGMGFFTLGADMAMMPIGEQVGTQLTRSKRLCRSCASCSDGTFRGCSSASTLWYSLWRRSCPTRSWPWHSIPAA